MSQKQLAATAELTPSFVSLIEHDRREPSISAIARLAGALDVPTEVVIWDAIRLPKNLNEDDRRLCEMAKLIVRRLYESDRNDPVVNKTQAPTNRNSGGARRCS